MNEFQLIHSLQQQIKTQSPDVLLGIGDDCAILKKDSQQAYLISTDCLVEQVHFDLNYFSFHDLGYKAMAVNLSDIAAMGGEPVCALVSLALPCHISSEQLHDLYDGFGEWEERCSVAIVGGDCSSSPQSFFINITVIGQAALGQIKKRSAAQVGDIIFVTGPLGNACLGLHGLQNGLDSDFSSYLKRPQAQVTLGRQLGQLDRVHALMDVSDGLVQDLGHMMKASDAAARINLSYVPRHEAFVKQCQKWGLDPIQTLLTGGEDYQLLGTMGSQAFATQPHLIKIGEVVAGSGVEVLDDQGNTISIIKEGFQHF